MHATHHHDPTTSTATMPAQCRAWRAPRDKMKNPPHTPKPIKTHHTCQPNPPAPPQGLARMEELVRKVVDLVDNRVEMNLRMIANTLLVDLPSDRSFSYEDFVTTQNKFQVRGGACVRACMPRAMCAPCVFV